MGLGQKPTSNNRIPDLSSGIFFALILKIAAEARIPETIQALQKSIPPMERELRKIEADINETHKVVVTKRREVRKIEHEIEKLREKKKTIDREAAAAARRAEIEAVVSALMDSGKSSEEIIAILSGK